MCRCLGIEAAVVCEVYNLIRVPSAGHKTLSALTADATTFATAYRCSHNPIISNYSRTIGIPARASRCTNRYVYLCIRRVKRVHGIFHRGNVNAFLVASFVFVFATLTFQKN